MKRMPTAFHAAPLAGLALRCQPDARLVTLCREGQERAFEEIVRRYRPPLVRFAAAIVPPHRAEDVVQETLAKAHSSLATTDVEIRLKPWLYTIARNRALNDLRDQPAHQALEEDFDGVPQPPEVAAQRSELAAVLADIKSLPAAQREALVRRELEGRSHREIAGAIGVSPGAVRGLIFRARAALRDTAGALIPLPLLRALLNAGPLTTEATGVGVGGAAAGLASGSGGGLAVKAATALLIAGLAVGSGVALHDRDGNRDATAATVAQGDDSAVTGRQNGSGGGRAERPSQGRRSDGAESGRGHASRADSGEHGDRSSSGPGRNGDSTGGRNRGEDGGHRGGAGDDGAGDEAGGEGDEGPDDHHNVGGETGGEHEGGGETNDGGGPGEGHGEPGSSDGGGATEDDGSGQESEGSHEVADQPAADEPS
jgi:RNA polymerase sigma factor (sigma-70 family)